MSINDTYYGKEDDVQISADQAAIDNYRDARSKLNGMAIGTPNMHKIYDLLQPYHDTGTDEQKANITAMWTRICEITDELSKTEEVLNGAEQAILSAEKLRKEAKAEFDKLLGAIENMDMNHKVVADFYMSVEEDQQDYYLEMEEWEQTEGLETLIKEMGGNEYVTRRSYMARDALAEMKDPSTLTEESKYWLWGYIRSLDVAEELPETYADIVGHVGVFAENLLGITETEELSEKVLQVVQDNYNMTPKQKAAYKAFLLTLVEGE